MQVPARGLQSHLCEVKSYAKTYRDSLQEEARWRRVALEEVAPGECVQWGGKLAGLRWHPDQL